MRRSVLYFFILVVGAAWFSAALLSSGCRSQDRTRYVYVCEGAPDLYVEYPNEGSAVLFYDGYKRHVRRVHGTYYEGRFYRWETDSDRVGGILRARGASAFDEEGSVRCERAP